jgi:hypothetical protein
MNPKVQQKFQCFIIIITLQADSGFPCRLTASAFVDEHAGTKLLLNG